MMSYANQTVTRQRPTTTAGSHGNNTPVTFTELPIHGCLVQPGDTDQDNINRDGVLIAWTVFMPVDADVQPGDRLVIDEHPCQVFGQPQRWTGGVLPHTRVLLKQWEG